MRSWFIVMVVICLSGGGNWVWSQTPATPAAQGTIGSPGRPPSAYRYELTVTPREKSAAGNLLVTGNVTGGKHFQGTVPYTHRSRLQTTLASTTLDSFYRQAARSDLSPQWSTRVMPYYSAAATTTFIPLNQRGSPGLVAKGLTYVHPEQNKLSRRTKRYPASAASSVPVQTGQWPVSFQPQRGENLWQQERSVLAVLPIDSTSASQDLSSETPIPWAGGLEPKSRDRGEQDTKSAISESVPEDTGDESLTVSNQASPALTTTGRPPGVALRGQPALPDISMFTGSDSNEALSAEQRDEAKELLTQYEGLAHFHRSQFEAWMAMGLAFMKQGEADRAENAFTLAAQYEAEHPRALAAKFVVLLTQAEYTRSALFLGRALAGESAYAAHPEALPLTMAAEQIKQHIRAIETTLQTVPAPELLFLVGYLYYLQDDVRLAHHALVRAQASKVSLPGLATLLAAVEARLAKRS